VSAAVPQLVRVKCRACSHFRDPREFSGGPIVGVCWRCYEGHIEGLAFLSGHIPKGCQECGRTYRELNELAQRAGLPDTRLVLERKDGIFQVLCLECDAKYFPKRRDLYGKTPDGIARGI